MVSESVWLALELFYRMLDDEKIKATEFDMIFLKSTKKEFDKN